MGRSGKARDDRIFGATHWIAAVIVPFLLAAFVILYLLPDDTERLFAWTIKPRMTPLIMGAGYIAGAYFFARVFTATRWHRVELGFLPVTTFTIFMALATVLHWDRFHHGHIAFVTWVALYAITPFLVPALWFRNRATDPETPEEGDVIVPVALRWAIGLISAANLGVSLLMFFAPGFAIAIWPWKLTPLTARVIGGWFALPGVTGLGFASDPRWSASRIPIQSAAIGLALILIGIFRAWDNFDRTNPLTWLFAGAIALTLAVFCILHMSLDARRGKAELS